jgi:hypothetical protein
MKAGKNLLTPLLHKPVEEWEKQIRPDREMQRPSTVSKNRRDVGLPNFSFGPMLFVDEQ